MGCGASQEDAELRQRNEEIEKQLKKDKLQASTEVKMLLLGKLFICWKCLHSSGAGESGKSTILKQMKLIHGGGYTAREQESFKEIIFSNTVQSMRVILEAMQNMGISLKVDANEEHARVIMDQPNQMEPDRLPPDVAQAVRSLWRDPGVQECFSRSREYQLNDSAK